MLGLELNGLVLETRPEPVEGRYAFQVMERYYGRARGGRDLSVCYRLWVPAEDVQFRPAGPGVVLGIRPAAFDRLEKLARERGVDDIAVYPDFGG